MILELRDIHHSEPACGRIHEDFVHSGPDRRPIEVLSARGQASYAQRKSSWRTRTLIERPGQIDPRRMNHHPRSAFLLLARGLPEHPADGIAEYAAGDGVGQPVLAAANAGEVGDRGGAVAPGRVVFLGKWRSDRWNHTEKRVRPCAEPRQRTTRSTFLPVRSSIATRVSSENRPSLRLTRSDTRGRETSRISDAATWVSFFA